LYKFSEVGFFSTQIILPTRKSIFESSCKLSSTFNAATGYYFGFCCCFFFSPSPSFGVGLD
jgi:hypothetical protein